jgi:hypothetical protein
MNRTATRTAYLLKRPERFAEAGNVQLRPYQKCAIQAVANSVLKQRGFSFVWIFPRQSGKDEALAIEVQYLLALFKNEGGEMVFFNPTFKPQTETSMRRLENRLNANPITTGRWKRRSGYIFQVGNAYCTYLSADPTAHVVSATANRLLVVNEAQDVGILKYEKDIYPMVSSTNATRLFAGTRWTNNTLLEREYQLALKAQKKDGLRRVFFFTAEDVRKVLPAYGETVDGAVARLGRQHPLVKTQFFCETVDAQAGMFPAGRQALIRGSHAARTEAEPGKMYAFLIDVAGQDEIRTESTGEPSLLNPGRDSTFLKIVEVDMSTVGVVGKPTYRAVFRMGWTGTSHVAVFGALKTLAEKWNPRYIVIDATGVGEGLWSMLDNIYGEKKVLPVKFTAQLKSALGYGLLGMMDSGRYQEYHPLDEGFQRQLDYCRSEILPGVGKMMHWGVPDGTRDRASGMPVHDDDLITSAMCTMLDRMEWVVYMPTTWITPKDPLEEMDGNY